MSEQPKKKVGGGDTSKTFANKLRRLAKHVKKHPGDAKASSEFSRLDSKGTFTARKASKVKRWTRELKILAHDHRTVGYSGNVVFRFGGEKFDIYTGMKEYHMKALVHAKKTGQLKKKEKSDSVDPKAVLATLKVGAKKAKKK